MTSNTRERATEEARRIVSVLASTLPARLDGRACVAELQRAGWNWRQMEWPGFYFEWKARNTLMDALGGGEGPRYGRTTFDFERNYVWDLKAHPAYMAGGGANAWAPLNDVEYCLRCIRTHNGLGFVIMHGAAEFDIDGSFVRWHDSLKGAPTAYVLKRRAEGARNRVRKVSFAVDRYDAFFFEDESEIQRALAEGWFRDSFQRGMRNSNDTARRAKYTVLTDAVPNWALAARARPQS